MNERIDQLLKTKGPLAENEVKDLLRLYDIKTTRYEIIKNEEDVKKIDLKYPVALKVCSKKILHKTDVGGVKLDIKDEKELKIMFKRFKKKFPKEILLVDQMAPKGVEIIIGLVQDPTFGLTIMTGVGGIYTELYKDVSFRVVPIDEYEAEEMLNEVKGKKLLEGFRNIKADKKQLLDLLIKVSKMGNELKKRIDQLDLNPVFIYENDYCVVDAKLILK